MDVGEFCTRTPRFVPPPDTSAARRCQRKLERHVLALLEEFPYQPLHHTLGISGYERSFDHPDELFYALALAWPQLPPAIAARVQEFARAQLHLAPPYALEGYDLRLGRARESYTVPPALRATGRGRATSAFGVYAFWAWCHATGDAALARSHWERIQERVRPLLESDCDFDLQNRQFKRGEPATLNGDLAGLLGVVRLARWNADRPIETRARQRAQHLLELRVNLERVNAALVDKSNRSTKGLHNDRLGRYEGLVPEVGEALRRLTDGRAAERLRTFRQARNGWFLAFGDRLIGGENYTNPLPFSRALFAGVVCIERLPAEEILSFLDVPWCRGDFYFIEKCALALWAAAGCPWAGETGRTGELKPGK